MTVGSKHFLLWLPRVLCILFACFISLFALDVFGEYRTFWQTAVALTMHLLPTFLVLAVLLLSWRREWVGAIVYIGMGLLYVLTMGRHFDWTASAMIGGPLFVIGVLFLVNWARHDELKAAWKLSHK